MEVMLCYDVMEGFRPVVDRLVLRCIGLKVFKEESFQKNQGKCYFTDDARKRFIQEYEQYMGDLESECESSKRNEINKEAKRLVVRLRELDKDNAA